MVHLACSRVKHRRSPALSHTASGPSSLRCMAQSWGSRANSQRKPRFFFTRRASPLHIDVAEENIMQNDNITKQNTLPHPADAIEMLKADHRRIRALFQRYDAMDDQVM